MGLTWLATAETGVTAFAHGARRVFLNPENQLFHLIETSDFSSLPQVQQVDAFDRAFAHRMKMNANARSKPRIPEADVIASERLLRAARTCDLYCLVDVARKRAVKQFVRDRFAQRRREEMAFNADFSLSGSDSGPGAAGATARSLSTSDSDRPAS